MNTNIGARTSKSLKVRLEKAAKVVGLDSSDLLRIGALRVIAEVEETGTLKIKTAHEKSAVVA